VSTYEFGWSTVPTADLQILTTAVVNLSVLRAEIDRVLSTSLSGPSFTLDQICDARADLLAALDTSRGTEGAAPKSGLDAQATLRLIQGGQS